MVYTRFGLVATLSLLSAFETFGQATFETTSETEQLKIVLTTPLRQKTVVRVQDKDRNDIAIEVDTSTLDSATSLKSDFVTTIVLQEELARTWSSDAISKTFVLATTAFERLTDTKMLGTDHMRSTANAIGRTGSVAVNIASSPSQADGKRRVKVRISLKKANLRLVHIRPEIWRLEDETWILEEAGGAASMSL